MCIYFATKSTFRLGRYFLFCIISVIYCDTNDTNWKVSIRLPKIAKIKPNFLKFGINYQHTIHINSSI